LDAGKRPTNKHVEEKKTRGGKKKLQRHGPQISGIRKESHQERKKKPQSRNLGKKLATKQRFQYPQEEKTLKKKRSAEKSPRKRKGKRAGEPAEKRKSKEKFNGTQRGKRGEEEASKKGSERERDQEGNLPEEGRS